VSRPAGHIAGADGSTRTLARPFRRHDLAASLVRKRTRSDAALPAGGDDANGVNQPINFGAFGHAFYWTIAAMRWPAMVARGCQWWH
jgi:hypothetical protein